MRVRSGQDIRTVVRSSGKRAKRNILTIFGIAVFCITILSYVYIQSYASAVHSGYDTGEAICYESILIEPGDSLWSIANEHMPSGCTSVSQYMDELRTVNNLHSDNLIAGNYLSVVCTDK